MKFTTHLELHSQTTRLVEGASHGRGHPIPDGILKSEGQAVLGRQLQTATPWLTERHGFDPTCALSVSGQYLALDEIYHPFRAAFPNNSTRRRSFTRARAPHPRRDSHPSRRPSGLRKTIADGNSLAHRTTWLRSDLCYRSPASI